MSRVSVAVLGSGAIGQFYGAQFVLAGYDVRFLARRDASVLARRGLVVHQTATPEVASSQTHSLLRLEPNRFCVATEVSRLMSPRPPRWVLMTTKVISLAETRALLGPLATSSDSRIVVLSNGLGIEDHLAADLMPSRLFGLLCSVAVNRDDDGTIRHLGLGGVSAGHFLDEGRQRAELAELCRSVGILCREPPSLLEARWRKLCWNVPFNGLCALHDVTTDRIVQSPVLRALAKQLAEEVLATANADLARNPKAGRIEDTWAEKQVRITDGLGSYAPSTLLDVRAGRAIEFDILFGEPLRRAERLGIEVPNLRELAESLGRRVAPRPRVG